MFVAYTAILWMNAEAVLNIYVYLIYLFNLFIYINVQYVHWLHYHLISCHASHQLMLGKLHEAREPCSE